MKFWSDALAQAAFGTGEVEAETEVDPAEIGMSFINFRAENDFYTGYLTETDF